MISEMALDLIDAVEDSDALQGVATSPDVEHWNGSTARQAAQIAHALRIDIIAAPPRISVSACENPGRRGVVGFSSSTLLRAALRRRGGV